MAAAEIKEMLKTAKTQRQQFAALHGDQLLADGSIPITFTKVDNSINLMLNSNQPNAENILSYSI